MSSVVMSSSLLNVRLINQVTRTLRKNFVIEVPFEQLTAYH